MRQIKLTDEQMENCGVNRSGNAARALRAAMDYAGEVEASMWRAINKDFPGMSTLNTGTGILTLHDEEDEEK